jgi:hypothetical protein
MSSEILYLLESAHGVCMLEGNISHRVKGIRRCLGLRPGGSIHPLPGSSGPGPRSKRSKGPEGRHFIAVYELLLAHISNFGGSTKIRQRWLMSTQMTHHARQLFQDVYLHMLKKHEVECDLRCIWD